MAEEENVVRANIGSSSWLDEQGRTIQVPVVTVSARGKTSDGSDVVMMLNQDNPGYKKPGIEEQVTAIIKQNGHEFWVQANPSDPNTVTVIQDVLTNREKTVSFNDPKLAEQLSGIVVESMMGNAGEHVPQHDFNELAKSAQTAVKFAQPQLEAATPAR